MLTRITKSIWVGWLLFTAFINPAHSIEIIGLPLELAPKPLSPSADALILSDACAKVFSVKSGKVSLSTTLWLFGEFHNRFYETIKCVEGLTANIIPHTIYAEDIQANMIVPCQKLGFKQLPDRTCVGWDDVQSSREVSNLLLGDGLESLIKLLELYHHDGMTSQRIDSILKSLSIKDNIFRAASLELLKLRDTKESYQKIFSREHHYALPPITKEALLEVKRLCILRNLRIIEIMKDKKIDDFGIFITGRAHLEKKDQHGVNDTCASHYINEYLQKSKHRNNYVSLTMNENINKARL
jgi:hypothetical protein